MAYLFTIDIGESKISQVSHEKPVVGNWRGFARKISLPAYGRQGQLGFHEGEGHRGGLAWATEDRWFLWLKMAKKGGQKLSRKTQQLPTTTASKKEFSFWNLPL